MKMLSIKLHATRWSTVASINRRNLRLSNPSIDTGIFSREEQAPQIAPLPSKVQAADFIESRPESAGVAGSICTGVQEGRQRPSGYG